MGTQRSMLRGTQPRKAAGTAGVTDVVCGRLNVSVVQYVVLCGTNDACASKGWNSPYCNCGGATPGRKLAGITVESPKVETSFRPHLLTAFNTGPSASDAVARTGAASAPSAATAPVTAATPALTVSPFFLDFLGCLGGGLASAAAAGVVIP